MKACKEHDPILIKTHDGGSFSVCVRCKATLGAKKDHGFDSEEIRVLVKEAVHVRDMKRLEGR